MVMVMAMVRAMSMGKSIRMMMISVIKRNDAALLE
jgi:hypothetical protein